MDQVFIVYKTDSHHSYNSRDIIGIATTTEIAVSICQRKAAKDGDVISDEQLWNLRSIKQTQGYEGEGEFQYESVDTDTLL